MAANLQLDEDTERTMKQFREFLLSYNKLSEMCFTDCVHDFTTRKVLDSEDTCAKNCMDKYLKMTHRISQRFQESQMMQGPDASLLNKQNQPATPFGMFTVLYIPTVRTLMSTAVNNSEQGVIFGAISAVESICAIIGTAIFNPIYANTQTFMTGFVFIVMAMFFMSGCCVLLVYIICYWQKDDQNQHPVPNSKEEPPTEDLDDETEDDRRPILSSDTAVVN